MLSGVFVATAPNFAVFMVGRALLGVAIGGFWSMSTATIMRLVPSGHSRYYSEDVYKIASEPKQRPGCPRADQGIRIVEQQADA